MKKLLVALLLACSMQFVGCVSSKPNTMAFKAKNLDIQIKADDMEVEIKRQPEYGDNLLSYIMGIITVWATD